MLKTSFKNLSMRKMPVAVGIVVGLSTALPVTFAGVPSETKPNYFSLEETEGPLVRSTASDPVGDWIERNADRFGLVIEQKKKNLKSPLKVPPPMPSSPSEDVEQKLPRSVVRIKSNEPEWLARARKKTFTPPPQALNSSDAAAQIAAVMSDLEFSDKCSKFATPSGFGAWGEVIVDELMRGRGAALMEGTDDLRRACPNYDRLGTREKTYVWVKVFASMSFLESSCEPTAGLRTEVQGPNGSLAGLLQLHKDREGRYAGGCRNQDSLNPLKTLRCGISMLDRQIEKTSSLFSKASYWGVLRPQGDVVQTRTRGKRRVVLAKMIVGGLKELPFCQKN